MGARSSFGTVSRLDVDRFSLEHGEQAHQSYFRQSDPSQHGDGANNDNQQCVHFRLWRLIGHGSSKLEFPCFSPVAKNRAYPLNCQGAGQAAWNITQDAGRACGSFNTSEGAYEDHQHKRIISGYSELDF